MAIDIKRQMAAATKANKAFNIELDESTHINKDARCTVYVRYTAVEGMIEDIVFCTFVPTTTTAEGISKKVIYPYKEELNCN